MLKVTIIYAVKDVKDDTKIKLHYVLWKWKNILINIWREKSKYEGQGFPSTIVIPSDPNALAERLELLLASKAAGNTGVRNELVSICDELLRQKIMNKKQYKNLMLNI